MGNKWFVQREDSVDGPMSAEDVKSRLASGQLNAQCMIWGRGLQGWQTVQSWLEALPGLANSSLDLPDSNELWHYALNGKSHGPFEKPALVEHLKRAPHLSDVMVWTKGMKEWAPVYEFHELLTLAGVNKRQFPRADIRGEVTIKTGESTLMAKLVSISESGCGVELESGLVPGQPVTLEIQSPSFREPLHAKAECRYLADGQCGLKFSSVNSETKGLIVQYVRQSQPRFVLKAA